MVVVMGQADVPLCSHPITLCPMALLSFTDVFACD